MDVHVKIEERYTPHVVLVLVLAALTATRVRGTRCVLVWYSDRAYSILSCLGYILVQV